VIVELPDIPRWVEAHGIATSDAGWRRDWDGGFALGHDAARLAVIAGEPAVENVRRFGADVPEHVVLVELERERLVRVLEQDGRRVVKAILHTLPSPELLPDLEGGERLPAETSLVHVPPDVGDEIERARRTRDIWAAWVDERPVAFAYTPWRSGSWFDISVDTLGEARQLGLGTVVAVAMIRAERAAGREPVWGADEDNAASLRLAARLGFVATDAIWVAAPAGPSSRAEQT
jgi:hypothetical protein